MKTLKLFLVSLLFLFGIFFASAVVKAEPEDEDPVEQEPVEEPGDVEEPAEDPIEDPVEEFESTVKIEVVEYGDIICDIENGHIGDEVNVYVKPNLFCKLVALYVNDTELVPDENGNYKFILAEGENKVKPIFEIDNEKVAEMAKMISDLKGRSLKDLFTFDNLLILFYFVLTSIMTSGYFITILKSKKIKSSTIFEVSSSINKAIDGETTKAIEGFLKDAMQPILENVSAKLVNVDETCKVLARCMILSQEDTPAARLAIIDELTKVQKTEEDLAAQVREIIGVEIAKKEQQLEEKKNTIAELEAANENIVVKENKEEDKGRY